MKPKTGDTIIFNGGRELGGIAIGRVLGNSREPYSRKLLDDSWDVEILGIDESDEYLLDYLESASFMSVPEEDVIRILKGNKWPKSKNTRYGFGYDEDEDIQEDDEDEDIQEDDEDYQEEYNKYCNDDAAEKVARIKLMAQTEDIREILKDLETAKALKIIIKNLRIDRKPGEVVVL